MNIIKKTTDRIFHKLQLLGVCQLCWQTLLIIELGLVFPDLFDDMFMYVYMC